MPSARLPTATRSPMASAAISNNIVMFIAPTSSTWHRWSKTPGRRPCARLCDRARPPPHRLPTTHAPMTSAWLVSDGRVLASAEVAADAGRAPAGAARARRPRWRRSCSSGPAGCTRSACAFPIDVAYLDADGNVLKTVRMGRHRVGMPVTRAKSVVEAEAGAFGRWGLHVGDTIEVRSVTPTHRPGGLVLVSTPIGNLGDLSPRAVEALAAADAIACEDTRRTGRLLQHAGVAKRPADRGQRAHRGGGRRGSCACSTAAPRSRSSPTPARRACRTRASGSSVPASTPATA